MALGFNHACISGISFGITDLETPKAKQDLVSSAEKKLKILNNNILMASLLKVKSIIKLLMFGQNVLMT